MTDETAIMLRATLTREEYAQLRIIALRENRATKDVAGDAIRIYIKQQRKGSR